MRIQELYEAQERWQREHDEYMRDFYESYFRALHRVIECRRYRAEREEYPELVDLGGEA